MGAFYNVCRSTRRTFQKGAIKACPKDISSYETNRLLKKLPSFVLASLRNLGDRHRQCRSLSRYSNRDSRRSEGRQSLLLAPALLDDLFKQPGTDAGAPVGFQFIGFKIAVQCPASPHSPG